MYSIEKQASMKYLVLLLVLFPFCSLGQEKKFEFAENSTVFVNQRYTCGGIPYPCNLVSIKLLKNGDISICIKIEGVEKFCSRADIHDLHAEFFGNGRTIVLRNGCEFYFEVTGNTPEELQDYFKDLYWGRK